MGGMSGDTDAPAQHQTVLDRHDRLGVGGDACVHRVLIGPELHRRFHRALHRGVVEGHHVPAGAQAPFPRPDDHHGPDRAVVLPLGKGIQDHPDHLVGECVDGARAIERDDAGPAATLQENGLFGSRAGCAFAHARTFTLGYTVAAHACAFTLGYTVAAHACALATPTCTLVHARTFADDCSLALRSTSRPMTTRMISLVPSRIWCTRRSRTTRSMPYSCR